MHLKESHGFWKDMQIILQYLFFTFVILLNFKSMTLMNSLFTLLCYKCSKYLESEVILYCMVCVMLMHTPHFSAHISLMLHMDRMKKLHFCPST
jgi:hypothetical protein